jgi:hypothetical protein
MRISRLTCLCVLMIAVSSAGAAVAPRGGDDNLARLRAKLAAADARPKSDPALVRQHIIELLSALPDLVPNDAAYAARMASLKARFEAFTPEQAAGLAYVDDAAFAPAVEHVKRVAAERRLRLQTPNTKPIAANDVTTALPPPDYDSVCGSSTTDPFLSKAEIIAQDVAELAAIGGQAACDSLIVIVGEGTNVPLCLIAFGLHEVVEGIQFARDLQDFCNNDVASVEAHTTFGNIYRLHDDLAGSVASGTQNTTTTVNAVDASAAALASQINAQSSAILQEVDSKAAQVIGNGNANRDTIIGNDNSNRDTIVGNDNTNRTQIITNDNTNRNQIITNDNANRDAIISNDNANRDIIIAEMRVVSCELNRLLNTPEGQRSSAITSCAGQPGFPYKFSARSILNPAPSSTSNGSAPLLGRGQDGVAILPMMGTVTMETNLLEGRLIPSYYLPLRKGGMLEQVQTLVWNTINAQLELNIAVDQTEQARKSALEADQLFVQQRFVEAYRTYATAYQKLIPQVERVAR